MSNIIEGIAKDLKAIPENLKAKAGSADIKKLVLMNVPYILWVISVTKWRGCGGCRRVVMLLTRWLRS